MAIVFVDIELVNDNTHLLIVQSSTEYVEDDPPAVVSPNVTITDEDAGVLTYTALHIEVICKF